MTSPSHTPFGAARLLRLASVCILGLVLTVAGFAADAVKKNFNISADDAARALKQFAAQSGEQLLYSPQDVAGAKTLAVKGEFTAREALEKMLEGSTLVVVQDKATGALAVRPETAAEAKNGSSRRAIDAAAAEQRSASSPVRVQDGAVKLDDYAVTGSRIRSLGSEATIQPVHTYTRQQIERAGVNSLAELRRLIPQLSVGLDERNGYVGGVGTSERVTFDLRGLGNNATLVLVNGRRLPRSGQAGGLDDYDLRGIPLSAVERVEVLLDGASAIYGADAMAGVVNVILKKYYRSTEFEFSYDNTFDSDVAARRATLTTGHRSGKHSLLVSGSYEWNNTLTNMDRWFARTRDYRSFGGLDRRLRIPGGTGQVRSRTAAPLPGLSTTVAAIPSNSDGVNLTVADFANAGAPLPPFEFNADLVNPTVRRSAVAHYEMDVSERLQLFADAHWSRTTQYGVGAPPTLTANLPAGYPGNPFGVPIRVEKYLWELGLARSRSDTQSHGGSFGFRGNLGNGWNFEASYALAWIEPEVKYSLVGLDARRLVTLMSEPGRPVLLHDSLAGPANPTGVFEGLMVQRYDFEQSSTQTFAAQVSGPVFELSSGRVEMAIGAEHRIETANFAAAQGDILFESSFAAGGERERQINSGFAELLVPIVGAGQKKSWTERLDLRLAGRADGYSDFETSTTGQVALAWRPASWILFRMGAGRGFKVPRMVDLYDPPSVFSALLSIYDPERGEVTSGPLELVFGGNPELRPEESLNRNFGFVLEVSRFPGLSISLNRFELEQTNRIDSLPFDELVEFFPERATREPSSGGVPGRIIRIDARSFNFAEFETSGYDVQVRWNRPLAGGELNVESTATWTDRYDLTPLPGQGPSGEFSRRQRPFRAVLSSFWKANRWEFGTTATHQSSLRMATGSARPYTQIDVQASYETGSQGGGGWMQRLLSDWRISATVLNVFNEPPRFSSFSSTFVGVDPRMRRYVLTLRKEFR